MKRPIIIAEAGNNHEGNLQAALELIERAKDAGADLVKFQAGLASGFARRPEDTPRYKKYELGKEGYDRLIEHGKKTGIPVFFSVWSDVFDEYRRLEWFKIAARQCAPDYIQRYATDKTFISIPHTLDAVRELGISRGIVLHCVSHYPAQAPFFWRFGHIRRELGANIELGWSDHFVGIETAVQAWQGFNIAVIEKHFTLKHDFGPLRDHWLSADPKELKELVERVKS